MNYQNKMPLWLTIFFAMIFSGLLVACGDDKEEPTPDPDPIPNPTPDPAEYQISGYWFEEYRSSEGIEEVCWNIKEEDRIDIYWAEKYKEEWDCDFGEDYKYYYDQEKGYLLFDDSDIEVHYTLFKIIHLSQNKLKLAPIGDNTDYEVSYPLNQTKYNKIINYFDNLGINDYDEEDLANFTRISEKQFIDWWSEAQEKAYDEPAIDNSRNTYSIKWSVVDKGDYTYSDANSLAMAFDEVTADIFSDVNDNTAIYLFDEFLKGLCEEFDEGNYRNLTLKASLVRKTDNRTIASKTFYIYSYGATVKIPAFRNPAGWSHNRMNALNRHKKTFEGITGKKYDWKAYTNKLKQVI